MTFGQKLKELRIRKTLTQKDLADQLHVTFQTVSKWENDTNEPDFSTLKEIAKLLDTSVEELLSNEEIKEEAKPAEEPVKEEPAPVQEVVTKTVIVHDYPRHVCQHCGKEIDPKDLATQPLTRRERSGRHTRIVPAGEAYYHLDCLLKVKSAQAEAEKRARIAKTSRAKKMAFGWGIAGGVVALGATLGILLGACMDTVPIYVSIILSIVAGYGIFSMLYCIIGGSYIADVFLWAASLSIKFPGLIFSWDLEGFMWLIAMKILFAVLGFLIGVFALLLAVFLSAALSIVSFPFILIHNEHTGYADSLTN